MNLSEPFIRRPVATSLLAIGLFLLGIFSYRRLPVAPLPRVDYPTLSVSAALPGADPGTMASAVATPLERRLGQIAGVSEMTSTSAAGSTTISLQFDMNRSITGAQKDVQAAIQAARGDLPPALPIPPYSRRMNAGDSPIMILALVSSVMEPHRLYELADTIVAQRISQIEGVSMASISGSAKSAVRVRLNPGALASAGLGMADVRNAILSAGAHLPKGVLEDGGVRWTIEANDQLANATDYAGIVVSQKDGAVLTLGDLGEVTDGVENTRLAGWSRLTPAVVIIVYKQPDANIIETVDRIRAVMPQIQEWLPASVELKVESERTKTIKASVRDVQQSLVVSVILVMLVMLLFLRRLAPTIIASVTVPLALAGTFAGMRAADYSLDNLSLMALTIAVGFVVDDAIVVIENIVRFIEKGERPFQAALKGARQVGFTVVSITVSLIAVFIPLLFMGGLIGRLMNEFAVTLSMAVVVSAVISLTLTPTLCARWLKVKGSEEHGVVGRLAESLQNGMVRIYAWSLGGLLRHAWAGLLLFSGTIWMTVDMYGRVQKGLFPQQDTGMLMCSVEASQDISFPAMITLHERVTRVICEDPAVDTVSGMVGSSLHSGAANSGRMFIALKPFEERGEPADAVVARLRKATSVVPGVRAFTMAMQDIRMGSRSSKSMYQYTLQGPDLAELNEAAPRVLAALRGLPELRDVNSDQQSGGLKMNVVVDRAAAAHLGVSMADVDNVLYDAFGQRQVATIYKRFNQHRVVMEVDEDHLGDPAVLDRVQVKSALGKLVPLSAFARFERTNALLSVTHQGQFPCVTLSFNVAPNGSLGSAMEAIGRAMEELGLPESVSGSFQGTAQIFQESLRTMPMLTLWALLAVYVVLGILYESLLHPLTILSTLPSAGLGALWALQMRGYELSLVSFIGIILLMGIVKKNAILMVDFAIDETRQGASGREAILEAARVRFRPIVMTTLAALVGSLPLAMGTGVGSEMRRPLGVAVVGGLIVSQVLTLYTTPVVYLVVERVRVWLQQWMRRPHAAWRRAKGGAEDAPVS
jgi:multidrug efflux pump